MSELILPDGWCLARVADITKKADQRIPEAHESFIYVDIGSINRESKSIKSPQHLIGKDAPSRARKIIHQGDVLVSLTRPNLNAVALVPTELDNQIASTGFEVLKPVGVDNRFVFALTRSQDFVNAISESVQGALYPAAKSSDVQSYEFPLPPLAEQKVIAEKLDEMLAKVERIKARLEQIPQMLKQYRQSVLTDALNGTLTGTWREQNSICNEWAEKRLDEISNDITYGYTASSSSKPIGPKLLRITDIQDGRVSWDDVPYCAIDDKKKIQYSLKSGDLVFARTGATVGKSFLIRETPPDSVYASYLIRVRCKPTNSIEYLALFFQSNNYWNQITEFSSGIGQPNVNGTKLKNLIIPIPELEEQLEIVRTLEQLFSIAERIEQNVDSALNKTNNLTQAILLKAFRGELTEKWRAENLELISGENSAQALLNRIKDEKTKSDNSRNDLKISINLPLPTLDIKMRAIVSPNKIIKVKDAFNVDSNDKDHPLSGQELLLAAGYPNDADAETLERFYLDLRASLDAGEVIKLVRDDGQDWFALTKYLDKNES